jgi:hypothetical protein
MKNPQVILENWWILRASMQSRLQLGFLVSHPKNSSTLRLERWHLTKLAEHYFGLLKTLFSISIWTWIFWCQNRSRGNRTAVPEVLGRGVQDDLIPRCLVRPRGGYPAGQCHKPTIWVWFIQAINMGMGIVGLGLPDYRVFIRCIQDWWLTNLMNLMPNFWLQSVQDWPRF